MMTGSREECQVSAGHKNMDSVCGKCYMRLSKSSFVPQIQTPTHNRLHKLLCRDLLKVRSAVFLNRQLMWLRLHPRLSLTLMSHCLNSARQQTWF